MRGLKTMVFYEELRCKTSMEYLKLHVEAVDNILLKKTINVFDIKKLNDQLKQRLDIALDTELVYKIASVVFFPKDENIEDYDYGFNGRKIQHWKKHEGSSFFLQKPLRELLPVLDSLSENLLSYITVVEKLNKLHLGNLLDLLPESKTLKLKDSSYLSLAMTQPK